MLTTQTKQKVYLAGPFFTSKERKIIEEFAKILRTRYDVFVPMEHFIEGGEKMENYRWGEEVFKIDIAGIDSADFAVVVDHGFTSDAGTAWEAGYIFAKNKPAYVISACAEDNPVHSVMMINGCAKYFRTFGDLWQYLCNNNEPKAYYELGIEVK